MAQDVYIPYKIPKYIKATYSKKYFCRIRPKEIFIPFSQCKTKKGGAHSLIVIINENGSGDQSSIQTQDCLYST